MKNKWDKYLSVFKNFDKIADGIKNNIFKKEHIEAVATDRFQKCIACSLFDAKGDDCLAPGTQPCSVPTHPPGTAAPCHGPWS